MNVDLEQDIPSVPAWANPGALLAGLTGWQVGLYGKHWCLTCDVKWGGDDPTCWVCGVAA